VLGEGVRVRLRTQLVQERRRPFDVAEEQGDGAGRSSRRTAQSSAGPELASSQRSTPANGSSPGVSVRECHPNPEPD
jgi:hypothetical protein